ncbi:aldose 1-epimerase [Alicyclobacillus sp. SO9]|uniref:aldose 1-epimerase n=1 Tax=Alicyclobacillus sp. SO9 TaxID=2665646 RepID=UPI0018E8FFB7|nr:aldose 1-epimerase [Alicyclobacillus sp. SO9]QQE77886.1 aldose 1-epimerase [Alicyclobacillus sp. SO9]
MNARVQAYKTYFYDLPAISLKWNQYEVVVLPENGGNLVSFADKEREFRFLHEPDKDNLKAFYDYPYHYGIPVLLPPNRYDAGQFTWNNDTYQMPVTEPEKNTHLHGFLYDATWAVEEYGVTAGEAFITLVQRVAKGHPMYTYWPHEFTLRLRYALNSWGLSQHVMLRNDGDKPMPRLFGLHTAINAPFAKNAAASDYLIKVTVGDRWNLDKRGLPDGGFTGLSEHDIDLKTKGMYPFVTPMDNHYTACAQNGHNRMELHDRKNNVTLVYDVSTEFKQWMIWNNEGNEGFICAEPQVNVVNAPNLELDNERRALYSLEPREVWETVSRLYCK